MPTVYPDNSLWGQIDGTYNGYILSTNNGIQTMNMTSDITMSRNAVHTTGYWNIPEHTVVITNGNSLTMNVYYPANSSPAYFYINGTIINNGNFSTPQTGKKVTWQFDGGAQLSSTGKIINYPNNYFRTTMPNSSSDHYLYCFGQIINSGRFSFNASGEARTSRFARRGGFFLTNKPFEYFATSSGSWTADSVTAMISENISNIINMSSTISIPEINAVDINGNAIKTSLFKIDSGTTLNINSNKTLTNAGTIENDGSIENNGTITNNDTITNNGTIDNNNGTIDNANGSILSNSEIVGNPPTPIGACYEPDGNGVISITSNFDLPTSSTFKVPNQKTLKIPNGVTFTF